MSYWVRLPTSGPLGSESSPDLAHESADESAQQQLSLTRPIVFLHGVGLGLVRAFKLMIASIHGAACYASCNAVVCSRQHDAVLLLQLQHSCSK